MKQLIERALLIALHETEGIGWKTIQRFMANGVFGNHMTDFEEKDWIACGVPVETARRLSDNLDHSVEEKCRKLTQNSCQIITKLDEGYPDMLKSSPQAPWVLYLLGNVHLLTEPGIAMVGTRVPTAYGRKIGSILTEELTRSGLTVVSGMARGIDSVIHETALKCGGNTIAVLGAGIDVIYPPENRSLYEEISVKGLVLSEYPPGTKAHPGFFPQRNRIIAGMTLGTLVVEADARSGSLITADAALEAGRDVFAVPGPVTSPKSRGTLDLIKQGAKLVTCAQDVLEEYGSWLPRAEQSASFKEQRGLSSRDYDTSGLTNDEMEIYHMLQQGPGTLDELLERSRWDFGHLHSVLLSLIIKKQITQLPGAIYKLI
ncbi:DNA processing protein [Paenibacillus uliginis N3/975]|uniref:DNA processing protein n=1 Tax=Paenibacillus uliginis N3/975 TaxID=1313296 RepID=A0A1X7H8M3_9BACL|nr:DNA-processing protein DprA [Paenibacillus uliginis]SMF81477.1 DNA processing protein [Paenibacillus uliginis N3/975]